MTRIVLGLGTLLLGALTLPGSSSPAISASSSSALTTIARSASGRPIEAQRLGNSDYCGHCHTDIFHQWNASTHHFSSFNNPVYRKVALDAARQRGPGTLKFCASCHDPLPLLAGEVPAADLNTWAANAGITCLACHRITAIHGGNGTYEVTAPVLHPFALSDHPLQQTLHRLLLRFTPALHRSVLTKPFYESPEYCASCHTVTSPAAINGVRDLVMQDEYGPWQASHFAGTHVRDPKRKRCIDCHMPLVPSRDPAARDGRIRSHRFTGGNTLLPALNLDHHQLRATEQFLRERVVELRCSAVVLGSTAAAVPCSQLTARPGDRLEVHIDISNRGAGHHFPAGTSDSNEAWVALKIADATGRLLLSSGVLDAAGNLDAASFLLQTRYADSSGKISDRRTATTQAVSKVNDLTIPAAGTRTARYLLRLPTDTALPLQLHARLEWRKYPPSFLRWVFDGREVPAPPITTMAELQTPLGDPSRQPTRRN